MSWISMIMSIVTAAFPRPPGRRVKPPPGLRGARVSYADEGRAGRVIFSRGPKGFAMYYEFGGGDAVAIIDVPSAPEWEKATGFPVRMRRTILEFIGLSVVRDQTTLGRGRFEIHERSITIHA